MQDGRGRARAHPLSVEVADDEAGKARADAAGREAHGDVYNVPGRRQLKRHSAGVYGCLAGDEGLRRGVKVHLQAALPCAGAHAVGAVCDAREAVVHRAFDGVLAAHERLDVPGTGRAGDSAAAAQTTAVAAATPDAAAAAPAAAAATAAVRIWDPYVLG